MPSIRRCVFGCYTTGVTVHKFPNPSLYPERFQIWVDLAGASVAGMTTIQIYKNRRVCDKHFADKDRNRNNRLNALAIPHLHIPKPSTSDTPGPSMDLQSNTTFADILESPTSGKSEAKIDLQVDVPHASADILVSGISALLQVPWSRMNSSSKLAILGKFGTSLNLQPRESPMSAKVLAPSTSIYPSTSVSREPSLHLTCYKSPGPLSAESELIVTTKPLSLCKTLKSSGTRTKISSAGAQYYQTIQKKLKFLRSEISRLRKKGRNFKERLRKSAKLAASVPFDKLTNKMSLPTKIFTLLQFRECGKKPKGRRFLTEEKVLALSLYKRSPKCYALLSKCFTLPSPKSLKSLLAKIVIKEGVNPIIFKKIAQNVKDLPNDERLCILIFDEMYINPQIHYDEKEDKIKGVDSFGTRKIADHVLSFMIKTIKNNNKQPVAYYFTNCLNVVQLKTVITEVVRQINSTGLKIIATVCDQSRVNVSAIDSLVQDAKKKYFSQGKVWRHDIFIVDNTTIIPIYDVPHLIKGVRNNLITKNVKYVDFNDHKKEKIVNWEYFKKIYEADKIEGELKILYKFTEAHIYPERMNKMKVKLATQLFSHSMAVAANYLIQTTKLDPACQQIIPFVLLFDKIFDSLNCNTFNIVDGKIYRAGVRADSPHHKLWVEAIRFLKSLIFFEEKRDGTVVERPNIPTVKNFVKTIEGMQAIWKVLSNKYGFDVMLCRNFNQDPLENFFGRIRGVGARNISPNSISFEGAYKSLLLNNFSSSHSIKSNCEDDMGSYFQSLDFFLNEGSAGYNQSNQNNDVIINEELLDSNSTISVGGTGQREYVCGWAIKSCIKFVCKTCKTCRHNLIDSNTNDRNSLIRYKEFCIDKQWLVYPSKKITYYFHDIQQITESVLKRN